MNIPLEDEFEEEQMICPSCHAPNPSYARYCGSCHVPLDSTVMLGPIGQIEAEGFALREATTGKAQPVVVIGIWLLFFPILIGFGAFTFSDLTLNDSWSGDRLISLVMPVGVTLLSLVVLYQTTTNFLRRRRASKKEDDPVTPSEHP